MTVKGVVGVVSFEVTVVVGVVVVLERYRPLKNIFLTTSYVLRVKKKNFMILVVILF